MSKGAARALAQRLNNTAPKQETVNDAAAVAFARRLQERGIVGDVPGLPEDESEPWGKKVLRILREDREATERYEAEKAQREAEEAQPQTAAGLLAAALSQANHSVMPLNGAQVLRAALAGGSGTINGQLG